MTGTHVSVQRLNQSAGVSLRAVFVSVFQGKTVIQAEIDAAAELIDFFRFNAKHAVELEKQQPLDAEGSTNTMLYRGLEVKSSHTYMLNTLDVSQLVPHRMYGGI